MRYPSGTTGPAAAAVLLIVAPVMFASERMPARVLQARYVALGYDLGDRFLSEAEAIGQADRITPEDRKALDELRDVIEKWERYVITPRPNNAELLIAVRAGRRAQASGAHIGGLGDRPGRSGGGYGVQLSSGGDMLSVYDASSGTRTAPLWRVQRQDGFGGASPTLVEQFKADVERAAVKP